MRSFRIIATLTIIGVISGGLLAWVYSVAKPKIDENRRLATKAAVLKVLPGAERVESQKSGGMVFYRGSAPGGRSIGYAFRAEASGFQGKIGMMVGVDGDFSRVIGLAVLENIETPGLGNRISEAPFTRQFVGIDSNKDLVLVKNQTPEKAKNQVEAITGATISSRAVVAGLNAGFLKARKAWKAGARK